MSLFCILESAILGPPRVPRVGWHLAPHGVVEERRYDWVRLFRPDGTLVPTAEEAKDAEIARLRALPEERGQI